MEITEDRDGTYIYTTTKYNRTLRATNQAEDSRSSIIFPYDDHHILAGRQYFWKDHHKVEKKNPLLTMLPESVKK